MADIQFSGINLTGGLTFTPTPIPAIASQQAYTTPGTYSWVAPAGVTSVCVVCVGGGGSGARAAFAGLYYPGGSGGGLGYKNNISVTPGQSYTVVVGAGGANGNGGDSYFISTSTVNSTIFVL